MKKIAYFFFYYFAKLIDLVFLPFAALAYKAGYSVIEVRNKSFGHHIWEPLALYYFNSGLKHPKKLIFLSDPRRARIQSANQLLYYLGTVIESYTFLSPIYWLARSPYCGLKRNFTNESKLKIFYDIQRDYVSEVPPFSNIFSDDSELNQLIDSYSFRGRRILFWKPKISSTSNRLNRSSSLTQAIPLIQRFENDGFLVVAYCETDLPPQLSNILNIYNIVDRSLREKLCLWLDINCSMGFCGHTGGSILLQLMNKPLIVYDIAYPFSSYFFSTQTLLCFKSSYFTCDESPVPFQMLPQLKNYNQLGDKDVSFYNCTSDELIDTYDEMLSKLYKFGSNAFPPDSYLINQSNISFMNNGSFFANYGYPQVSDACFRKLQNNGMIQL